MKKFMRVLVLVLLVALGLSASLHTTGDPASRPCKQRATRTTTVISFIPDPDQLLYTDKLSLSGNGKILGTVCLSGICLFDTSTGAVNIIRNAYGRSIAISPDSSHMAVGDADGCMRLVDVDSGQILREWGGHWIPEIVDPRTPSGVFDMAFSPQGDLLASVGDDGALRLWSVSDGRQIWSISAEKRVQQRLTFSPDGRFLAVLSSGNPVMLIDVEYRQMVKFGSAGQVGGLDFGGENRVAVTQNSQLWVVAPSGGVLASTDLADRPGGVAISPDGKLVALSQPEQNSVLLWHVDSGERAELVGFAGAPDALVFSPDGKKLYVAALAEGIVVFDVTSKERETTWKPCGDKKAEGDYPPIC